MLTDFGISRLESTSTTGYNTETLRGSTRWLAYEFFQISDNDDDAPPGHTEKTDVWSYGMTVLVCLYPPLIAMSSKRVLYRS